MDPIFEGFFVGPDACVSVLNVGVNLWKQLPCYMPYTMDLTYGCIVYKWGHYSGPHFPYDRLSFTVFEMSEHLLYIGEWIEPQREKTGFLHMRKQRRRSASR